MKEYIVGNEIFSRKFSKRGDMIFNSEEAPLPCLNYEGLTDKPDGNSSLVFDGIRSEASRKNLFEGPHETFSLDFADCVKPLRLNWKFRFFKGVAGYESGIEFVSDTFPLGDWRKEGREDRLDILPIDPDTVFFHLGKLRAATDYHNEFANFSKHKFENHATEMWLDGNILRTEKADASGLIIMNMGPSHHDRRDRIKAAFKVEKNRITVYGWGVEPHEFALRKKMFSRPLLVVPYSGGHFGAVEALRNFLRIRWKHSFGMEPIAMVNPWGGGGYYLQKHMNEKWVTEELKATAALGAGHYQIDDGWENGSLLAMCQGTPASKKFWTVDRKKFPSGFAGISKAGRKFGVKPGLWFCPDFNRQYENWEEEAAFVAEVSRRHGFEYFKIDGATHKSYAAEQNFDSFLKKAFLDSGRKIIFNQDVTAGIRKGFLYSPEFGPLFPANRYPHVKNGNPNKYYPCNTLRNFWMLSHIIPPHLIQVEIPNIFFDPAEFSSSGDNRYSDSDPGNPLRFGPLYCAMIGFFGSPLFWLQPSRTDKKLIKEYSKMAVLFARFKESIHKGFACPIGEAPNGSAFTGFMSRNGKSGAVLVFREQTERKKASIFLPGVEKAAVETVFANTRVDAFISDNCLDIRLEGGPSFALLSFRN